MYDKPVRMTQYPDGSYRIVCMDKIKVGDEINVGKSYFQTDLRFRKVSEIIEERPSRGRFLKESDRPISYRLNVIE